MTSATGYPTGLGRLCKRGHRDGGDYSLRYLVNGQPIGNCVRCGREANARRKGKQREARQSLADLEGRQDGKFTGTLCRRGHDSGGGGSERYVYDGACVECDRARRREKALGSEKERTRKRVQNRDRATREFRGQDDLVREREQTFENESRRRALRREVTSR